MPADDHPPRSFFERTGARVIVIDAESREVLLMRGADPADRARGDFWITPGGGLDENEDTAQGAARELWEEVGLHLDITSLGPVVLRRIGEFPFAGELVRQTEAYYAVVTARFEPSPRVVTSFEEEVVQSIEWRSLDEIATSAQPVYPNCLVPLVSEVLSNGHPTTPWSEEQRLV
ncbi:MAG: NUDIX domain-containing protein [Acidimicrobiales bacterium]|nr:NUDIX domain-containing protein [Acidimicrobiales bacterium]